MSFAIQFDQCVYYICRAMFSHSFIWHVRNVRDVFFFLLSQMLWLVAVALKHSISTVKKNHDRNPTTEMNKNPKLVLAGKHKNLYHD